LRRSRLVNIQGVFVITAGLFSVISVFFVASCVLPGVLPDLTGKPERDIFVRLTRLAA
jgi:hypothetical protein